MPTTHDCPTFLRNVESGGFLRTNAAFRERIGFSDADLSEKPLFDWINENDHDVVRSLIERGEGSCEANHRTLSGDMYPMEILMSGHGADAFVMGRCMHSQNFPDYQLEHIDEASVSGTLDTVARIVEAELPGYKCSILLVADGHFVKGAGPSLPDEYNAAIDGYAIGPTVGSCGTAIYWNVPVIVEDIQADPLWTELAGLAKDAGVAACWSHPFSGRDGSVLGALALYASTPQAPTIQQINLLQAAARMTGLAVERGRAEEELREKRKREVELENQLRQAAKMEALGVLAGGVAHDFNNVLATILGNAELAVDMLPGDSEVQELLSEIVDASLRAGSFCQQMLAYSGKSEVSVTRFELGSLLPQLSVLVQAAMSKKTELVYSLHPQPTYLEGDENQLLQVIMNLVINAADALGSDEGRIEVATELVFFDADSLSQLAVSSDLAPGEYVRLTVSDNGCGISQSDLNRIFDPFFTTKATGRGLGLAAAQGIVLSHSGAIQIVSEPDQGTTFTVLLPTAPPPEPAENDLRLVSDIGVRKCILVVDDDVSLRTVLCRRLGLSGFDVIEAADGQEAVDVFSRDHDAIDCVLLDLSMPKLSGDEVHQSMHSLRDDMPIILMSGYAESEILNRIDASKLSAVLKKPVPSSDIVAAVQIAVGSSDLRNAAQHQVTW